MKFFILGENSFLGKEFYVRLKKIHQEIYLINHSDIDCLVKVNDDDVLINFCGVNRSKNYEDYNDANYVFLKKILATIKAKPYFIHVSSYMVNGFNDKEREDSNSYQQWFINSKLEGEKILKESFPTEKLCILRPTNIYGYSCTPYYNNIVTTLIHEKITQKYTVNRINRNCIRNILSIEGFCNKLCEILEKRLFGSYNIVSDNTISLEILIKCAYDIKPDEIEYFDGAQDEMNMNVSDNTMIVNENLSDKIKNLEYDMRSYMELKNKVVVVRPNVLSQSRGDMIEISDLNSKRLYKITLTCHAVRGNHFHYKQIEEFYTNHGHVLYILSNKDKPNIVYIVKTYKNTLLRIEPNIIHTLTNDYIDNFPEIIIGSTQQYISGKIPDTEYIKNI